MTAPFHAHSVAGRPEAEWELLRVHLREVAEEAGRLAGRLGLEAVGQIAGLLHDLGKYLDAFQRRLYGGPRMDHAAAGARWARDRLPAPWGGLIAHVVAGHHTGLRDGLLQPDGRLAQAGAAADIAARRAAGDQVELTERLDWPEGFAKFTKGAGGFQRAFLTRMVFSCLVDADRRCAARFDARQRGVADDDENEAVQPDIAALEAALARHLDAKVATSELNRVRAGVRRDALGRAAEARGVFSLTVPTGGGKTLTSLAFALAHARAHGLDRVVVVIPFTSVIEQTAAVYREALGDLSGAVLEHHSGFEMADEGRWDADRVGPDRLRLAMERWDRPIVVTTAVQFFESLFASRTSRCRKLHSLARSVIVLDEAQTMPLHLLRPCVAALKELARAYGSSVVLCTATQPALRGGAGGFEGGFAEIRELVSDVPGLFSRLRRVSLRQIGAQDDAALAGRIADSAQVLCIVNQRAHAQALFGAIRHLPGARHLSTCMHSVHRQRVLAEIRDDLAQGRACRVVSTSLVEAGVDVDFRRVMRAEAGLDQVAQAAGRCNREFRFTPEESEVLMFSAPGYPVVQSLKKNAEAGAETLRHFEGDPFSPPAIRDYFERLYWRATLGGPEGLDRGGVMRRCEERRVSLDFPFESIAEAMRFIDDEMVPVIVPVQDGGEVRRLLDRLPYVDNVGSIARALGRYTVGVPRRVRSRLLADRAAVEVCADRYADQFVELTNLDIYTDETGLDWTDPMFKHSEGLFVA